MSFTAPEHLNGSDCRIRHSEDKGKGVYASQKIQRNTVIEISPVLFVGIAEYEQHGNFDALDHHTYKWKDGRMAVALGLGSLFNHSNTPNVSYTMDPQTDSIRYETARDIYPDEELCIFYDHKVWFDPVGEAISAIDPEPEDGWRGLSTIGNDEIDQEKPLNTANPDEIVHELCLPFKILKPAPEGEDQNSIRTVLAWVVDVPEPRHLATLLKWLKGYGLDDPNLGHLKTVRKKDDRTTLLLSIDPTPPQLPVELELASPFQIPVPSSPAVTLTSLSLKSALWPTFYAPKRKGEIETWSCGRVAWAREAMEVVITEALKSQSEGELPISAYMPASYGDEDDEKSAVSHDTRTSTSHPLRHAVLNLIRQVANLNLGHPSSSSENGSHYLLTGKTVFLSHEPCVMCSMALLHSRVKQIFYLNPMSRTGGCGGATCLPMVHGVNHRFEIFVWKQALSKLAINEVLDA
ncbi:cytidine deaminase-like protein [Lentinula aff. detonsa]|uniref:Cytidine deaminase-like protein n=1 Tax=Lentinula aff. detonsa TaxID=2804958 RepID=A0AA38L613_9AGAR|nr:cytidine deaminase-like protein [Lentinula aff. detonsa]